MKITNDINISIIKTALIISSLLMISKVSIADEFTGDLKLSCEAVLCLSTGSPPSECNPALSRYYSINFDDFGDTIWERINFLNICPVSSETPQMKSLINAIANGAGRCDATPLNTILREWVYTGSGSMNAGYFCISNQLPSYCSAYTNHEYTDLKNNVKYVIDPPSQQYNPFNNNPFFNSIGNTQVKQLARQCGHWVNQ